MSSTTSKIIAATASGYHILKIEGYSGTKFLSNGRSIKSPPFTAAGHRWSIEYYPNGKARFYQACISLYLVLEEDVASPVKALVQFSFAAEERRHLVPFFPKKSKTPAPLFKSGELDFVSRGANGCDEFIERSSLEKSKNLRDDSFTIRCDIVVLNGFRAEDVGPAKNNSAPRCVYVPPSDLIQHLGNLLTSGKGADVVFEVGGEMLAAHRCLLAARSPVFATELFGSMSESGGAAGVVRVADMEGRVFRALLRFLYTDSWPETAKEEECAMAQHLLVAADRYGMERLKLLCEDNLCKSISLGTAANILALAELHNCNDLKDACIDFLISPGNLSAAMTREDFENLKTSCPSLVKELIDTLQSIG
ncbi:BTB/POZ and MATH domain-containing protein 1-like [Lolium rigidum]|uniref:BTB/POZ and MATH domain-containing protein 1-like n=1 Tax=Lolium rigidum TaxID=89674 RepID=UPI001F5C398E|nr:BTB/POZ and MATH domain-containing protein 1-like [Lolium rigidum]